MSGSLNRNSYFDNARFILIVLVVFGHLISPFREESHFISTVYNFIYSFHMPAFILIAGFFSKGYSKDGYMKKVLYRVLVPYITFQFFYYILYSIQGKGVTFTLMDPYWTLWFLLSLLCWNILLKVFTKFKYPLFYAVIVGMLVGYIDSIGSFLSLSRTFVFFPLFLLGFYLNENHFKFIINKKMKVLSTAAMIVILLTYYFYFPKGGRDWLIATSSYFDLGIEQLHYAMFIRLFIYILMFVITVCFLTLVPKERYFFTHLGGRTLYIYLLHGLVIKVLQSTSIFDFTITAASLFVFILTTLFISFGLASKPVITFTKPIIEMYRFISLNQRENKNSAQKLAS
ncbi:acyltransferase family protein [Litchfieldia alkalitelluris]|uniref:acyltransferase family protein n=1 Tax=Litchfieldia alkalitelluris TaxID=304268 RepID=UPI001472C556|nr:acyltransferase family protein [Litchfieldia alkalitelluris]